MIVRIDKGFQKDVGKINDVKIKSVIADTIESIRTTDTISAIKNLKKLTGYKEFYRIRIGDYRIGLRYTEDQELIFIRFLHRKEIYKRWP